jgi:hypothetical protein
MLVFFVTWILGYVIIFLTFINVLVDVNMLKWKYVLYSLLISIFSWLILLAYGIIYLYERLSSKRHKE